MAYWLDAKRSGKKQSGVFGFCLFFGGGGGEEEEGLAQLQRYGSSTFCRKHRCVLSGASPSSLSLRPLSVRTLKTVEIGREENKYSRSNPGKEIEMMYTPFLGLGWCRTQYAR